MAQDTEYRSFAEVDEVWGSLALGGLARMDAGTEHVTGPREVTSPPGGHDAQGVGGEPFIAVDWFGASNDAS